MIVAWNGGDPTQEDYAPVYHNGEELSEFRYTSSPGVAPFFSLYKLGADQ